MESEPVILEALREAKKMAKLMNDLTSCRGDDDYVWGVQKLIDEAIKVAEAQLAKDDLFAATEDRAP